MKKLSSFNQLLTALLIFIGVLILFRVFYSGSLRYITMSWNIFLAWVPYILSHYFTSYRRKEKWKQFFLFGTWLLFFPNALYILTDLVHLQDDTNMPWWFDTILVFCSSFVGLVMAFISLYKTEQYIRSIFHKRQVMFLISLILFISSFGVYLGRFQRWNSWDVIQDPVALGFDILYKVVNPLDNYKVWAFTILFTVVYSFLYFFVRILPESFHRNKNTGR